MPPSIDLNRILGVATIHIPKVGPSRWRAVSRIIAYGYSSEWIISVYKRLITNTVKLKIEAEPNMHINKINITSQE